MLTLFVSLLILTRRTVDADTVGDGSDSQPDYLYANPSNFTTGGQFEKNLNVVLDFLVNGSETYRYGVGEDEAFGFRRCYFRTTPPTCSTCLEDVRSFLKSRVPLAVGARYWRNVSEAISCYLHYEKNSFFFGKSLALSFISSSMIRKTSASISPATRPQPPSPSNSSASSEPPTVARSSSKSSSFKMGIYIGIGVGVASVAVLSILAAYCFLKRRGPRDLGSKVSSTDFKVRSNETTVFRHETLRAATRDFNMANEIGHGGFGRVYKGVLEDGSVVAVKKLSPQSHQGRIEFINEITIITRIQHRNLVRLKGYCIEEERLLVYEFMENGSLDKILFGPGGAGLAWKTRHAVIIGVARGLTYLHEDSYVQIIHRDIKASNILLDKEMDPKISDFGISKHFESDHGDGTTNNWATRIAGTLGYMAPEYATLGRLTKKIDVFSFGMLVLEIISGRRCNVEILPQSQEFLLQWVWKLRQSSEGVVDHRLLRDETYKSEEATRAMHIALLCTLEDDKSRPTMSSVVAMFQGLMAPPPLPSDRSIPRGFSEIEWQLCDCR